MFSRRIRCTRVVINRAPEAPSGWPSAIAPPCGFVISRSAPVSASHAPRSAANASFTSKVPISARSSLAFASTLLVAGIGPVNMMTGSTPAIANECKRAIGVSPSSRARAEVVTRTAAAPSEICDELPAVTTPS